MCGALACNNMLMQMHMFSQTSLSPSIIMRLFAYTYMCWALLAGHTHGVTGRGQATHAPVVKCAAPTGHPCSTNKAFAGIETRSRRRM